MQLAVLVLVFIHDRCLFTTIPVETRNLTKRKVGSIEEATSCQKDIKSLSGVGTKYAKSTCIWYLVLGCQALPHVHPQFSGPCIFA